MTFDYSMLRGKIVEKYGTIGNFAETINVGRGWLSEKLVHGKTFRQDVILKMAEALGIQTECITPYFFTRNGYKMETNRTEKGNKDA